MTESPRPVELVDLLVDNPAIVLSAHLPVDVANFADLLSRLKPDIRPSVAPGSVKGICYSCGDAIWLGPTAQKLMIDMGLEQLAMKDEEKVSWITACYDCIHKLPTGKITWSRSVGNIARSIDDLFR